MSLLQVPIDNNNNNNNRQLERQNEAVAQSQPLTPGFTPQQPGQVADVLEGGPSGHFPGAGSERG